MRKNLTEEEFNKWKEGWMRDKGCPYFACSKSMFREDCGKVDLCGVLYDYESYKSRHWARECTVELETDSSGKLPTKICPSCTGSMCIKVDSESGEIIGSSWCKLMNDYYEASGIKTVRNLEKYIFSLGAFLIPIIGESAYLELNPED